MVKMNKHIKKKWIEALKSGEYKQIKGSLRRRGGFCCLGVLTDLYIKETNNGCWEGEDYFYFRPIRGERDGGVLNEEVMEWAELEWPSTVDKHAKENFRIPDLEEKCFLSERNDSGVDFDEIADIIEEYVEGK